MFGFLKYIFNFKDFKKRLLFLMLLAFLVALTIAHAYAVYTGRSVYIHGFQIHHFYFGTFCLAIGGIIALLSIEKRILEFASVLMGVGLGLFVDEIGLLLNCTTADRRCAYAFPDSFDIVGVVAVSIFILALLVDVLDKHSTKKRLSNNNS